MRVLAQAYSLPKEGNSPEEYEDAYWIRQPAEESAEEFSFAVADGATETSFSGAWAKLLVEAYCSGKFIDTERTSTLTELREKWLGQIGDAPLPWYAEEKLRSGAFSSLLGLTIRHTSSEGGGMRVDWEAMAIGDSCLFQVRDDTILIAFPLEHSKDFNSRPALLSSNSSDEEEFAEYLITHRGTVEPGDTFYLMTDALGCWFLKAFEEGEKPWQIRRTSPEDFERWVSKLRQQKVIRNDDVTMLRIEPLLGDDID